MVEKKDARELGCRVTLALPSYCNFSTIILRETGMPNGEPVSRITAPPMCVERRSLTAYVDVMARLHRLRWYRESPSPLTIMVNNYGNEEWRTWVCVTFRKRISAAAVSRARETVGAEKKKKYIFDRDARACPVYVYACVCVCVRAFSRLRPSFSGECSPSWRQSSSAATETMTGWLTRIFWLRIYLFFASILGEERRGIGREGGGENFDKCVTISRSVGCANSGAASHCRLIFERLAYTRLVLKKFIVGGAGRRERGRQRRGGERGRGAGGGRGGLGTASIRLQMLSAKFKVPLSPTRTNVAN